MAFFFSRGKKSLMVKAEGCAETKELKFMERDSVEKIIDKIREKFELTEEQTQDWGLYAPLRNVWASPDQTVGDLLLRNGDSIYYHRRPLPNAQDGEKPAEMKEEDWVVMRSRQMPASSRDLTHDYRNTLMPDREAASTFRGKSALYPSPVGSSGIRFFFFFLFSFFFFSFFFFLFPLGFPFFIPFPSFSFLFSEPLPLKVKLLGALVS